MNILAHLHLATVANSSIIGIVAADFVKGDPYRQYSQPIAAGIMMHRRVDMLTDQLSEVKRSKALFRPQTSRVAPIALDIIWDHFLSKHWSLFVNHGDVAMFNSQMKAIIVNDMVLFSEHFVHFMTSMWQGEWLVNYAHVDFIGKVLNGMAKRRPKLYTLSDTFIDFKDNYQQLELAFFDFYPSLILKAKSGQLDH